MEEWYAEITPLIEEKKFKPCMMYNWDESFLHADEDRIPQVCCQRDRKPVIAKAEKNPEHITVGCVRIPLSLCVSRH
jgi:hypothetical protein